MPELYQARCVSSLHSPRFPEAYKVAGQAHMSSFILNFLSGVFSTHHLHTVGFFRMTLGLIIGLKVRCFSMYREELALPSSLTSL